MYSGEHTKWATELQQIFQEAIQKPLYIKLR